jgi:PPOX class probable F420-dependent enzyme
VRQMDWTEVRQFLLAGTRTATIATIGRDGHPHVVPIWFTLDGQDVVFSTSSSSAKAKNLGRDPRVALSVDDDTPPFAFVTIKGQAQLIRYPDDFLAWTTRIARRYVGPDRAADMGTKYTEMDDTLVRIRVASFIAYADIVT